MVRFCLTSLTLRLLLVLSGPLLPALTRADTVTRSTNPSLTFFSSATEREFARLQAASLAPARRAHGPFQVPTAGVSIESPVLHLLDLRCTPEEWQPVLTALAAWQKLPSDDFPRLALPDGRLFVFTAPPLVRDGELHGVLRQTPSAPTDTEPMVQLLRLHHDGAQGLLIDLRARPARLGTRLASSPDSIPTETTPALSSP